MQTNGKLFLHVGSGCRNGYFHERSGYAVVSVIVGDLVNAGRMAGSIMLARGLNVLPIIYPAVPIKAARLRFFLTSEHTPAQIREAVRTMREELDGLRKRQKQAA